MRCVVFYKTSDIAEIYPKMTPCNSVNICSGNDLLLDGPKPLPESILTDHHQQGHLSKGSFVKNVL